MADTSDQPERSTGASSIARPVDSDLLQWIESLGGGLVEGVKVYEDAERGQHLRVNTEQEYGIKSGTCVARCPVVATISWLNLSGSVGLPSHSFVYDQNFLNGVDPEVAVAFFLMDQYLQGDASPWAPYIRSLPGPDNLTTTQYYAGEDLAWIMDTNLELAHKSRLDGWTSNYSQGTALLRAASNPSVALYSWERFLWALTIFSTRSFSSVVLKGFDESSWHDKEPFSVLLPLVDLSNHRPLFKVEWEAGKEAVGLKVLQDLQPGDEIYNNYGPKNNESLMVGYGFCMIDNVCDYRSVNMKAPPGSTLYHARIEQRRRFPAHAQEDGNYFIMSIFYPFGADSRTTESSVFSLELLDAIAILAANNRELATMEIESNRIHIPFSGYGESSTLLKGLSQLQFELFSQVIRLRKGGFLDKMPKNDKQRNAKLYREAQLLLLENAIVITTWILTRAKSIDPERSSESLLEDFLSLIEENRFGLPVRARVKALITERPSLLKHDGELFKNTHVIATLPPDTADCLRDFLKKLDEVAEPLYDESQMPISPDMVTYCVFTLFCVAAYRRLDDHDQNSILGPRIVNWVSLILENYPEPVAGQEVMVEDSDVDYLLTEIHHALEKLRRSNPEIFEPVEKFTGPWLDDDGWLSRHSFRWGWYVAEDETVQVAKDPFQFVAKAGTPVGDLSIEDMLGDFYLYIPHGV